METSLGHKTCQPNQLLRTQSVLKILVMVKKMLNNSNQIKTDQNPQLKSLFKASETLQNSSKTNRLTLCSNFSKWLKIWKLQALNLSRIMKTKKTTVLTKTSMMKMNQWTRK